MELITAREAFDKGLKRYYTGIVCKFGHISERMISNGSCVSCLKDRRDRTRERNYEKVKEWRKNNPELRAAQCKRYHEKHKDKLNVYQKEYKKKNIDKIRQQTRDGKRRMRVNNPEREKEAQLRYRFRLEQKKINEAGRNKPDFCEICKGNEYRIVFDHCHAHGNFRGWICDRCNRVLGIVKDSPELLRELALYLEQHNVKA